MKSIQNFYDHPAGSPLAADSLLELHASRILLLLRFCGRKRKADGRWVLDGLTKMAKLDFFVRYPTFFRRACSHLNISTQSSAVITESHMVRFHYGPWDQRYYHILAYLEGRGLIAVKRVGQSFELSLTNMGASIASDLASDSHFTNLTNEMKEVKHALGQKSGTALKRLIYMLFDEEVAQRSHGDIIT